MPIDPTGTKPGLVPAVPLVKTVHIKCRRDGCDSINAIEMTQSNAQGHHLYRCAKCNATWGIATGGSFNI